MDPLAGWTIAKNVADAAKKLYEIGKSVKDHEIKNRVDEVIDELRDLKQQASELEDENRNLKEKLRFKSDDFEFTNPFWYEKAHPDRPLCAKCFAGEKVAPMSEPRGDSNIGTYRRCLVCSFNFDVNPGRRNIPGHISGPAGPNSWMK